MTKSISKKVSSAKRKANLALTAFLAVAVMAITLTMVGVFDYATLNVGVQPDGGQANALVAPTSAVAQSSDLGLVQRN